MPAFVCVQCEMQFSSFGGCRAHIGDIHGSDVSSVTVKVFLHQPKKYQRARPASVGRKIMTRLNTKGRKAKTLALAKIKGANDKAQ